MSVGEVVRRALGVEVSTARRLPSGSINDAFEAALADGRVVFVKTRTPGIPGMYEAEARGLAWLAEPRALRVPAVLHAGETCLVLELVGRAPRVADHDVRLGRGLAALHRAGAPGFGGVPDNFLATLPQRNDPASAPTWARFYAERRLEPLFALAPSLAPLRRAFDRFLARLDDLVGPPEPPARLHGDLWNGNAVTDDAGGPVLIDPAVYGGHREMDLAMMRLFGGFSDRVFDAYAEAFPLTPGAEERVEVCQLYPLLAHEVMFGGWGDGVARVLRRWG